MSQLKFHFCQEHIFAPSLKIATVCVEWISFSYILHIYHWFPHEVYLDGWHWFGFLERLLGAEDGGLVLDDVHLDDGAAPPAAPGAADAVASAECWPPALHDHRCADILTLTPWLQSRKKHSWTWGWQHARPDQEGLSVIFLLMTFQSSETRLIPTQYLWSFF